MARNLELKWRCVHLDAARQAALARGAAAVWTRLQTDTYFNVPTGRLKLREETDVDGRLIVAELIAYHRADERGLRESHYEIYRTADPIALAEVLSTCPGVRGVVRKRRELLMYENVRIHLDSVGEAGDFVEFEAVLDSGSEVERSTHLVAMLQSTLGLRAEDIEPRSYAEVMFGVR